MRISIKRAIAEQSPVDIFLRVHELTGYDSSMESIILSASPDWLLACRLDDFQPNGFWAIRRSHVNYLYTTKYHTFRKHLMQAEKVWPRMNAIPSIDMTNAATILGSLKKLHKLAIVLCESSEEWDSIHCRIEQVGSKSATLLGFDGAGKWARRPKRLDVSDITRIRFGSRYLNLFEKYSTDARET
jgi:hypothetical protein